MSVIYITKQDVKITKQSRRLVVCAKDRIVLEIPDFKIERLVIFGNAHITTPALNFLLDRGIEVSFLTVRGRLRGRLIGKSSKNIFLRLEQFRRFEDEEYRIETVRNIIRGKIKSMISSTAENNRLKRRLTGIIPLIDRKEDVPSLRGLEGFATAIYFSCLAKFIPGKYNFITRNHRPATDPANACLSLGYTLLGNEIASMIEAHGLDPHLGFYHLPAYGRPSLALDILEEFRHSLIDRFVIYLLGNGWLKQDMFTLTQKGVRLSESALSVYLANYEKKVRPFRGIIQNQVEAVVRCIKNREVYRPHVLSREL